MWSLKEGAVGKGVCRKWVGRMYKDMVFGEKKILGEVRSDLKENLQLDIVLSPI